MQVKRLLRVGGISAVVVVSVAMFVVIVLSYAPHIAKRAVAGLGSISEFGAGMLAPTLVAERDKTKCFWLRQNWSDEERAWVHNVSQGTATFPVPYSWFQKLERPELSPLDPFVARPLISDAAYLERLGFIAPNDDCDPKATATSPRGYGSLPVGFAVLKGGADPMTGRNLEDGLGLTCAACHTGRILYKNTEVRIDGAPAMIDLGNLERVIGLSICYSDYMPWRKRRLAVALLEDRQEVSKTTWHDEKAAIERQLTAICEQKVFAKIITEGAILKKRNQTHSEEGFGRLDALNRIGNQVFYENLIEPPKEGATDEELLEQAAANTFIEQNFAAHNAPVSFPALWDVPHFIWAQYDASILNPAIRNIGEAIGVAARVNMTKTGNPSAPQFSSTVDVSAIQKIETLLSGSSAPFDGEVGFKGLQAPSWNEAASHFPDDENWKIDENEVIAGRALYFSHCAECHGSPPRDQKLLSSDPRSFWDQQGNWLQIEKEWLFKNVQKPVAVIGTDPEQARVLSERSVVLPDHLQIDTSALMKACGMLPDSALRKSFVISLMEVVSKVRDQAIRDQMQRADEPMLEVEKLAILGTRPNCPNPTSFQLAEFKNSGENGEPSHASVSSGYVAKPHYRARPLDGVWATAPYLHNGSVPTLDDLLSPQADRPAVFCVGPLEFDTQRVGLTTPSAAATNLICPEGMTRFDSAMRGNSNKGHSFEGNGVDQPVGVIGPALSVEERLNLIAYLKTL